MFIKRDSMGGPHSNWKAVYLTCCSAAGSCFLSAVAHMGQSGLARAYSRSTPDLKRSLARDKIDARRSCAIMNSTNT
jgi:hypothetical protein